MHPASSEESFHLTINNKRIEQSSWVQRHSQFEEQIGRRLENRHSEIIFVSESLSEVLRGYYCHYAQKSLLSEFGDYMGWCVLNLCKGKCTSPCAVLLAPPLIPMSQEYSELIWPEYLKCWIQEKKFQNNLQRRKDYIAQIYLPLPVVEVPRFKNI